VLKAFHNRKEFTAKNNTWEKEKDLKNTRELVDKFKGRMSAEVRKQEGINVKIVDSRLDFYFSFVF